MRGVPETTSVFIQDDMLLDKNIARFSPRLKTMSLIVH